MEDLFAQLVLITGVSSMAVQQLLKLNWLPRNIANTYPVLCQIVLSVIGTIIAFTLNPVAAPTTILEWITTILLVLLTATGTYFLTLRNWDQLRAMEN